MTAVAFDSTALRDNIREGMAAREWTQKELAQRAGIDRGGLSRFLGGKNEDVTMPFMTGIAAALETSVSGLLGESTAARGSTAMIPFRDIRPSPLNPRKAKDDATIAELARSIAVKGVLQNLIVRHTPKRRGPEYEIVAGERRWRAVAELVASEAVKPSHDLPCRVVEADDTELVLIALTENIERDDMHPLDEGEAFAGLYDQARARKDGSEAEITARLAKATGKTRRWVQKRIALARRLAPEVKKAFTAGDVTLAQAQALSIGSPEMQKNGLECIKLGYPRWRTAEGILDGIRLAGILPKDVLFKPSEYEGEVLTDPDDPTYRVYADRALCERLQRAAIAAKVESLKARWAFVEEVEWFCDWEHPKCNDQSRGGAYFTVDNKTLEFKVYMGYLPKGAAKAAPARTKTPEEPTLAPPRRAHLDYASREKTLHIHDCFIGTESFRAAVAVTVTALLCKHAHAWCPGVAINRDSGLCLLNSPAPVNDLAERLAPAVKAKRLRRCRINKGLLEIVMGAPSDLFKWLLEADDLEQIYSSVIALTVSTGSTASPTLGDQPMITAIAGALGCDLHGHWTPDAEYLAFWTKDALVRVAADMGLSDEALDKMPKKKGDMIKHILANQPKAEPGWLPPELEFGCEKEITAKLKARLGG